MCEKQLDLICRDDYNIQTVFVIRLCSSNETMFAQFFIFL